MAKNYFTKTFALAMGLAAFSVPAQTMTAPGNLPLCFEADSATQFSTRANNSEFSISPVGAQMALQKNAGQAVVQMQFVGANPSATIRGDDELAGKINCLIGNDSQKWRTGLATYAKVRVDEIYPGISLVYYGNQQRLEYDFDIAPGANPDAIKIHFNGVEKISTGASGELVLQLAGGEILQPRLVIYQISNGARKEIDGGYKILDAHTVVFAIGDYDRRLPLVIDPILSYSTYFGGNKVDTAWAVAVDTNGFIYVAGQTLSTKFTNWSIPPGGYQTTNHGGLQAGDAFIAKFDNLGSNLVYFTYLGGSGDDAAYALAVDNAGDAYIAGATDSTNFPAVNAVVNGAYTGTNVSGVKFAGAYLADAFVAELNTNGSSLMYSTYLGGEDSDVAKGIAVDSVGDAYITGFTASTNFPTTANAYQQHLVCTNSFYFNQNAFVAEIAAGGNNLLYSSYFGGTNLDEGTGIALDPANNIYIAGWTTSTNFPATNAIYQIINTNLINGYQLNGSITNKTFPFDAFVAEFTAGFANLNYSTLLGGANNEQADGIAVDSDGNAYITGWTTSANFPNTVTNIPYLHSGVTNNVFFSPVTNAFLTQIVWNGTNAVIGNSAVFGGTNFGIDVGYGVAVDTNNGDIFVVGSTTSRSFPVTTNNIPAGYLRATNSGASDVFIIAFSNNFSGLLYSTYLGGSGNDYGYAIALDPMESAYVVGATSSANFPTNDAFQTKLNGQANTFLAKIFIDPPELSLSADNNHALVKWNSGQPFAPELSRLFQLESSTNLFSTNWTAVTQSPVLTNNFYSVTVDRTNAVRFFRLHALQP